MRIETPGLDSLTATINAQFFEGVTDPAFRMPNSAAGQVLSRSTARYLSGLPGLSVAAIDILICNLHVVDDTPTTGAQDDARNGVLRSVAHEAGIPTDTARELLALVGNVKSAIRNLVARQMEVYTDSEVGALLVDLFRIDYDQFDPDDPANALDYNGSDRLPYGFDTPRDGLMQLTQEAVVARLIKSSGRQLIVAWTEAHEADEIAWVKAQESGE